MAQAREQTIFKSKKGKENIPMKPTISKSLLWIFLMMILISGASTNALASGGPAPLPPPGQGSGN
jgi:hypothetical protein